MTDLMTMRLSESLRVFTIILSITTCAMAAANAAVVARGNEGPPLSEARPATNFLKPDVNIITAQPSPSEVNPAFLGPVLLMKQAQVDLEKGTARLPLRKGRLKSGELVWFVLTDTTDENLANLHGLDYSPKLAYGLTGKATREATIDFGRLICLRQRKGRLFAGTIHHSGSRAEFLPAQGRPTWFRRGRELFAAGSHQECCKRCHF